MKMRAPASKNLNRGYLRMGPHPKKGGRTDSGVIKSSEGCRCQEFRPWATAWGFMPRIIEGAKCEKARHWCKNTHRLK